ncbi:hypothetical protein [Arthrobacter sp. QXT-31]|uniref:hypothetical protein n=1 Tax=Arthrobacter sp. QXT-31 TaxID=1357915 RepID=UPI00097180B1|nr:hypothetical protein [Arthrobacter sp. QXT-31]APX00471.1 hypothetical protein BWQ92_00875 [Arthrobacter sp. QXT-31]
MMPPEPHPAPDCPWHDAPPVAGKPCRHAPPCLPARGGILRRQVLRLIHEVLTDETLDPATSARLLGQLAAHRGHPEQALLAHLLDVQTQDGREE